MNDLSEQINKRNNMMVKCCKQYSNPLLQPLKSIVTYTFSTHTYCIKTMPSMCVCVISIFVILFSCYAIMNVSATAHSKLYLNHKCLTVFPLGYEI